jgi:hypothetical protein
MRYCRRLCGAWRRCSTAVRNWAGGSEMDDRDTRTLYIEIEMDYLLI